MKICSMNEYTDRLFAFRGQRLEDGCECVCAVSKAERKRDGELRFSGRFIT